MSNLTTILTQVITNLYVSTGLLGIVLAMAIESCCIPLPSEIVMPLAGIMIASGKILHGINTPLALVLVALSGSVGCLIGSTVAYWIGYAGGRPLMLKYGRYVLISQHDADKADAFFQRWGSATAFFSRLLPVVRTYISLPAGIAKMPFVRFCIYTFLGSFPWSLGLAYVGFILGNHLNTLAPIFHDLDIVILLLVVVLVVLYIWRHVRNDRKARESHSNSAQNPQQMPSNNATQSWGQQPGQQGPSGTPQQWGQPPISGPQQFSAPPQGWGQPAVSQSPVPPQQFMQQQQGGQWAGQPQQQFMPQHPQQPPQHLSQFGQPPSQEQGPGQPQWSQWGQMPPQAPVPPGQPNPYSLYPQSQQPQQGWGQPTQPPQR